LIEASKLRKVFGSSTGRAAVDDVSFTVAEGELFVIMGLSGSGKSTLLRMLNRLIEPTSGALHVGGEDVSKMSPAELRKLRNHRLSMVFQHFALLPHRTVRENAAYGLRIRGVPTRERMASADRALDIVGLGEWGDHYPDELSGGMRQRVGLARALATDADVLLMDEPFSALDPLIRREMQDLLATLQRDLKKTIIFVTHDLNEAMRLGDRIMVMRDGKVVQLATGADILSSPADDYISDFVSDVDRSRVLTAAAIMQDPLVTATMDESPPDVLRRLGTFEAQGAFVLDHDGRLVGVATDDLLARATENGQPLEAALGGEFDTVEGDTYLVSICSMVGRRKVPLAVTGEGGSLLGVVPRAALLEAIAMAERPVRPHDDGSDSFEDAADPEPSRRLTHA
jgi:glycine betaine/proline transport system ATP-binding protein